MRFRLRRETVQQITVPSEATFEGVVESASGGRIVKQTEVKKGFRGRSVGNYTNYARKMDAPFVVMQGNEKIVEGNAGDWLVERTLKPVTGRIGYKPSTILYVIHEENERVATVEGSKDIVEHAPTGDPGISSQNVEGRGGQDTLAREEMDVVAEYNELVKMAKAYSEEGQHGKAYKTYREAQRLSDISRDRRSYAHERASEQYYLQDYVKSKARYKDIPEIEEDEFLPRETRKFKSAFTVVDIDSDIVNAMYKNVLRKLQMQGKWDEESILWTVAREVNMRISYGKAEGSYGREEIPLTMPLEFYVENSGVCREQAPAVVAILQRLREDNYITGDFATSAGYVFLASGGMHAWVTYVGENKQEWTVDATNLIVGKNAFVPVESDLKFTQAYALKEEVRQPDRELLGLVRS